MISRFGKKLLSPAYIATLTLILAFFMGIVPGASAQSTRRARRESNANRKSRIARVIDETYSHRFEVGGGSGLIRFHSGQYKQQNNEINFWGSTQYSLTPKLGVVGIATGGFGSAKLNNTSVNAVNPQIQNYAFMAGPSFRLVRKQKVAVSVYGTGGLAYGRFSTGPKDFPPATVGLWPSGLDGAFSVGVNVDYNLFPNLAVRVTPNYLGTTFGGQIQNNKALNIGAIYRFGKIK